MRVRSAEAMYVGDIAYAIPQGAHRMRVPLRGSDVRRRYSLRYTSRSTSDESSAPRKRCT